MTPPGRSSERERFPFRTIAVVLLLLGAAVAVVDLGGNAACGQPLDTFPPCAGSGAPAGAPPSNATPLVIAPQSINASSISAISERFAPYLISNDTIMLSSGLNNSTPNVSYLNSRLADLAPSLPSGIHFEARTAGLSNVHDLVTGGLSSSFEGVIYDYEPGFEPEFTLNFSTTLSNFASFAHSCHAAGFAAYGYPTSQPLWVGADRSYNWNYGALLATTGLDALQIQLQGAAHASTTTWTSAIESLVTEYAGYGIPPSAISVQLTLASGDPNDISVSTAYTDYEIALAHGVGQVVLWWNSASVGPMLQLLGMIR
ncbi:MAG TPA: hypothetical protein VMF04_06020 [Thermoplasmata archaeon]|nr:hypothetical protein [Thermoplasmata archaeon]